MEQITEKNVQGFVVLGMDFESNYGEKIHACFQFNYKGYEISVSTGAIIPSKGVKPVGPSPVEVTNITSLDKHHINGSVEDAINFVNVLTSEKINGLIFDYCMDHYRHIGAYPSDMCIIDEESTEEQFVIQLSEMLVLLTDEQKYTIEHQAV